MESKLDYDLGDALWELIQRLSLLNNQYFKQFDLGYSQYSSLMIIGYREGISIGELSKIQVIDKSTAGKTIQRLEKKGYATRKQNPNDKREYKLFLTKNGREILPKLNEVYDDFLKNIFSVLTFEEKEQYLNISKKMNEGLIK